MSHANLDIFPVRVPTRKVTAQVQPPGQNAAGGFDLENDNALLPVADTAYARNVRRHEALHALYTTDRNPEKVAKDNKTSILEEQALEDMRLHAVYSRAEGMVRRDELTNAITDLRSILRYPAVSEEDAEDAAIARVMYARAVAILENGTDKPRDYARILERAAKAKSLACSNPDKFLRDCRAAVMALQADNGAKNSARELLREYWFTPEQQADQHIERINNRGGKITARQKSDLIEYFQNDDKSKVGQLFDVPQKPEQQAQNGGEESSEPTSSVSAPKPKMPQSIESQPGKTERSITNREILDQTEQIATPDGVGDFLTDEDRSRFIADTERIEKQGYNANVKMEVHHLAADYRNRKTFEGRGWQPATTGSRILTKRIAQAAVNPDGNARVFSRKLPGQFGGTILLDASGSMNISDQLLVELAEGCTMGTVAYYSANNYTMGHLCIFSENQRRYIHLNPREPLPWRYGNNIVDALAMMWLLKQPAPRFYMTDCEWTGTPTSEALAEKIFRAATARRAIVHLNSIAELQELIATRGKSKRSR